MLSESIISKLEEHGGLIEGIINKKLNLYLNYFYAFVDNLFSRFKPEEKRAYSSCWNLKKIQVVKDYRKKHSLSFLRDGRLVSGDSEMVVIYEKDTYQSEIIIGGNYSAYYSVCGLRNGNLAFAYGNDIKVYKIDGKKDKIVHIIIGHTNRVWNIIELEDGRLCSYSADKSIRIWDKNYKCIQTLTGFNNSPTSVIEINDYLIAAADTSLKIWNKNTFEPIQTIQDIRCWNSNSLSKLKENTIIVGDKEDLSVVDVLSFEYKLFKNKRLRCILSILVLREGQVLLGNERGEIIRFDPLSSQIIFIQNLNEGAVLCIIKNEDNQIFSSSEDGTMNRLVECDPEDLSDEKDDNRRSSIKNFLNARGDIITM